VPGPPDRVIHKTTIANTPTMQAAALQIRPDFMRRRRRIRRAVISVGDRGRPIVDGDGPADSLSPHLGQRLPGRNVFPARTRIRASHCGHRTSARSTASS
jgi:hypothetical protein